MIITDMPDADYHRRTELSSTGVRRLLDSPARFHYWNTHPQPTKPAFDLGSAAHAKILGVGATITIYPDEHLTPSGAVSTKQATRDWEQEQRALGLIPIGRTDAAKVDAMAEAVLADTQARSILETITGREVTIINDVDGVPSRARFDLYGHGHAGDLKTTRDASPTAFNRSVGSYGYHIQQQWYEDVHRAETGTPLERFTFIVVESAAPHLVGVYRLDFIWEDLAQKRTHQARQLYKACTEAGEWPGYSPVTLTPPTWAIYENEDAEEIQI